MTQTPSLAESVSRSSRTQISARTASELCLVISFLGSLAQLFIPVHTSPALRVLVASVTVISWLVVISGALRGILPRRSVAVVGVAIVLGSAVAAPPAGSQDVWSYVMEGRMVLDHGSSPFVATPGQFIDTDPLAGRVPRRWRDTRSPYGPLFVAIETVGAATTGDSPTANRLFHQGLAATAVAAAVLLCGRRRRDIGLLVLGASPLTVMIVNGGHNDLLVGLAVVLGVMAVDRRKLTASAVAIAAAALIKLTAAIAVPAVIVWLWHRNERRKAVVFGIVAATTVALGYLAAGGMTALRPLLETGGRTSRVSLWDPLRNDVVQFGATTLRPTVVGPIVVLLLLVGLVVWRYRDRDSVSPMVTGVLVAQLATLPWLLPWYVAWALPNAAHHPEEETSKFVIALVAILAVAYAVSPGLRTGGLVAILSHVAIPVFLAIAAMVATSGSLRRIPQS